MKDLSSTALQAIEHASYKLGPVSALLDKVVGRVVPHVTALACRGSLCFETCTSTRCGHFQVGYRYYSDAPRGCEGGIYTCIQTFCGC